MHLTENSSDFPWIVKIQASEGFTVYVLLLLLLLLLLLKLLLLLLLLLLVVDIVAVVVTAVIVAVVVAVVVAALSRCLFLFFLCRFLVLNKVSQEGIEFLHSSPTGGGGGGPTVLTYRNGNSTELFISRAGIVFGSVQVQSQSGKGGRLHLAACPSNTKSCQLLILRQDMQKSPRIS